MNDITHYFRLRSLCKKLTAQEDIVSSDELDDLISDIALCSVNSLRETLDILYEFVELPTVLPLFDKFMEEKNALRKSKERK